MIKGLIHSIESFGTVDGPGVRYVVFLKGCPLRCAYCHNPDTWDNQGALEMTAKEVLDGYFKNKEFYKNGGITVTGGEPLVQIDFLTELLKMAKEENIHTAIDTSGITFNECNTEKLDSLMKYTDLILLDIKHIGEEKHIALTGQSNKNILEFAKYTEKKCVPLWIRHVVVPHLTDNYHDLYNLGKFIGTLKNVKALDVLPYHTMGVKKYEEIGIPYKLKGTPPLSSEDAIRAREIILKGIKGDV